MIKLINQSINKIKVLKDIEDKANITETEVEEIIPYTMAV
jgi:hypothetical protein